ncbi:MULTISPECIES: hypothetical protein [Haloferax]|uniref:hypothetical protein n=1 Tax=Haloferax TaxID=2251 RepID=UPI0023DB9596|nr:MULTISPECIES: hypothetical protein [Haloferax]MDS0240121.1 hypothetical protein [Haloferax sp. S2CR25]MDS0443242.1 hypothetical protein [Haloferax sp. S2CR25-2]WEL25544.1 hypothetical protein SVXHx_1233 [Haloferax lucentense]
MKELVDVSDDELRAAGNFLNDEYNGNEFSVLLNKNTIELKELRREEYETDDVMPSYNHTYQTKWRHGREEVLEEIERREIEL